jgi:hypothetical protein
MAAVIPFNKNSINKEHEIVDDNLDVLTRIYDENINLVVYKREISAGIIQYVNKFLKQESSFSFTRIVSINNVKHELMATLPVHEFRDEFISDINNICDMYAVLFDIEKTGLRLSILEHAMCPRFHVDNVVCRLLTTYGGIGTEWLSEDNLDRSKLGRGSKGLSDDKSGIYLDENRINKIKSYDIALLKGESWPNNTGKGAVHRSPVVNKSNPRLLLSLDIV